MPDRARFRLPRLRRPGPRAALAVVLLLPLGLALSCQAHFPSQSVPRMNWLVMPFQQPPTMSTDSRDIRGWWFGARTIRQNPRAGTLLADACTRAMAGLDYVNLFPSIGLKDYFAGKREALKKVYPYLSDDEVAQLLGQVPPIDFGRELGADKILTGRIVSQYMGEHRTIHWWWSEIEVECQVIDVPTGRATWTRRYFVRRQFSSMTTVQEEVASRLIEDLQQTYFRPLALGAGT